MGQFDAEAALRRHLVRQLTDKLAATKQPAAEPLVTARLIARNVGRRVVKPSLWTFDLSDSRRSAAGRVRK